MEKEIFEQNLWWKGKDKIVDDYDIFRWNEKKHKWIPKIIDKITLEEPALHFLTGPRQAGKTTVLKLLIRKLLENGKNPLSIFYFNCEHLSDYKELINVLRFYIDFRENNSISNSIILLDEITLPREWYRAIKFLIDKGAFHRDVIILSGSSSISVRREVELFPGRRGKGKDYILYPLSFREFVGVFDNDLVAKIGVLNSLDDIEKKVLKAMIFQKELNKYLEKYIEYGGFPLSVVNVDRSKDEAKIVYLNWIKNAILKADRSDTIARQIVKVLLESMQSDVSWEGISKKIEIKSPKTVFAYVDLLKSIFAVNLLYNIDISGRRVRFGKNKKIHLRDPILFEIFEEWCLVEVKNKKPAIAEGLVVEHLNRMFPEWVFFWRNGFEIDAIVLDKKNVYGFEVKWSEKSDAKGLPQLNRFYVITKDEYSKRGKFPLAVFLSLFDV